MAVKKANQDCWVGADCPPEHACKNGKCVPWAKPAGPFSSTSAKIGAGIIGAGVAAIGNKVRKNVADKKAAKKTVKELDKMTAMKKGGWIQGAIKKPGALREQLGVKKGEKIPKAKLAAAAKKGGKLGQRARLAITLGKMKKK